MTVENIQKENRFQWWCLRRLEVEYRFGDDGMCRPFDGTGDGDLEKLKINSKTCHLKRCFLLYLTIDCATYRLYRRLESYFDDLEEGERERSLNRFGECDELERDLDRRCLRYLEGEAESLDFLL